MDQLPDKREVLKKLYENSRPFKEIKSFSNSPGIYGVFFYGNDFQLIDIKDDNKTGILIYIGKTESSQLKRKACGGQVFTFDIATFPLFDTANHSHLNLGHKVPSQVDCVRWIILCELYSSCSDKNKKEVKFMTVIPRWQDILGRVLIALCCLGAIGAFYSSISAVRSASNQTVWVETWRMFGFLVFAGMFALLVWRPRFSAGIWELVFFHKAAMGISLIFISSAPGAITAGTVDIVLSILIVVAYICTRGWQSWSIHKIK
jgi:hypothetical protein